MKNLKIASMVLALSALVGCSTTPTHTKHDVVAKVVNSKPAPKVCKRKKKNSVGTRLVSAVIGGAIGNQIGGGNGKKIATAVGAVAGYGAANGKEDKLTCKNNGFITYVIFDNPFSNKREYRSLKTTYQERAGTEIELVYNHPITMETR